MAIRILTAGVRVGTQHDDHPAPHRVQFDCAVDSIDEAIRLMSACVEAATGAVVVSTTQRYIPTAPAQLPLEQESPVKTVQRKKAATLQAVVAEIAPVELVVANVSVLPHDPNDNGTNGPASQEGYIPSHMKDDDQVVDSTPIEVEEQPEVVIAVPPPKKPLKAKIISPMPDATKATALVSQIVAWSHALGATTPQEGWELFEPHYEDCPVWGQYEKESTGKERFLKLSAPRFEALRG